MAYSQQCVCPQSALKAQLAEELKMRLSLAGHQTALSCKPITDTDSPAVISVVNPPNADLCGKCTVCFPSWPELLSHAQSVGFN